MSITHILICGQTLSGKSHLARRLSAITASSGKGVIVYDPMLHAGGRNVAGWRGLVCNDWSRFKRAFWASTGCLCIIDEAADVCSDHLDDLRPMLTRGRHVAPGGGGGHCVALIAQRFYRLDKTAREQTTALFAFGQGVSDSKDLAEEWGDAELVNCSRLPALHYFQKVRFRPTKRGVLTFPK